MPRCISVAFSPDQYKNAEETASRAAKGVVKGAIQGVKESIVEAAARKNKKQQDGDAGTEMPKEK